VTVLAIDQGTSGTKGAVIGDDGEVVALAEVPVRVDARSDGAVETDPEGLWQSVLAAGRQALADAGDPALDTVALANQGETVLAWDADTTAPLTPAIVWQDRRSQPVCDRLADHADRLVEITGLELDPYFVAPKLAWLREELTTEGVVGTTDTWLLQRLSGAFTTDVATASRTLLLDLDAVVWSEEAVGLFGLDGERQATLVANDAVVGTTTAFGAKVDVRGTSVDQQAALFAEDCRSPGEAKCTYGTGAFLLANTGSAPCRSNAGLVACVAWRTGAGTDYCLDGQVYTVGSAVTWLQQVGLITEPAEMDSLVAGVADTGGATFVPGLAGLAAPFWAPEAKGAWVGLSLATERAHLVRATLEGVAAAVAWLARGVADDLGAPLERLRVDGGLTRSTALMQLQADLAQLPVEVYPSPHATALGVAQLGGASSPAWTPMAVYEPEVTPDEAEARLVRWRDAAEATLSL
jgi:glycerol kinase